MVKVIITISVFTFCLLILKCMKKILSMLHTVFYTLPNIQMFVDTVNPVTISMNLVTIAASPVIESGFSEIISA